MAQLGPRGGGRPAAAAPMVGRRRPPAVGAEVHAGPPRRAAPPGTCSGSRTASGRGTRAAGRGSRYSSSFARVMPTNASRRSSSTSSSLVRLRSCGRMPCSTAMHVDDRELQPLGRVQRHDRDAVLPLVPAVHVAGQRDVLQEVARSCATASSAANCLAAVMSSSMLASRSCRPRRALSASISPVAAPVEHLAGSPRRAAASMHARSSPISWWNSRRPVAALPLMAGDLRRPAPAASSRLHLARLGVGLQVLERHLADAAGRLVDDPQERQVVARVDAAAAGRRGRRGSPCGRRTPGP